MRFEAAMAEAAAELKAEHDEAARAEVGRACDRAGLSLPDRVSVLADLAGGTAGLMGWIELADIARRERNPGLADDHVVEIGADRYVASVLWARDRIARDRAERAMAGFTVDVTMGGP